MKKVVGLSLSFCVRDIMDGKVAIDDVQFITSGTHATCPEDWDEVIATYRKAYWYKDPDRGEVIARYFIGNGLILQPRMEGNRPLFHNSLDRKWIPVDEFNRLAREVAMRRE